MRNVLIRILMVLLLGSASSVNAQKQKSAIDYQKIDTYIEKTTGDWGIPGLSVGIVKDGQIVFSKGYGTLEQGTSQRPDGQSLYAIASNSKAFTASMIAMLVQEEKLDWNDKVQKYLPRFELYDPLVSREMTVLDLLCHRAGLGTFSGDIMWYKSDISSEEIVNRVKHLPQAFGFRDGYGYSNVMYITAGEIIRQVTGKSWGENLQERILDPLGMTRTIYSLKDLDNQGNYATPHALEEGKNTPIPWVDWEEYGALGGIISSVEDMGKWMIFNMNNGINGKDTLLNAESLNKLWSIHNAYPMNRTGNSESTTHFRGYGLGWGLSDYYGKLRISHGGAYDGMISSVNMIPEEKLGIVVLTNGMKAPATAITNYLLDIFLGNTPRDWSAEMLERANKNPDEDPRITEIKTKRVLNTTPSLPLDKYAGTYHSDLTGKIEVIYENNQLKLRFEHAPDLSATLEHWHFDVWKINWDHTHAWFNFGTVKFNLTNNLDITGLDFNVPNHDIFFEELRPVRVR